MRGAAWEKHIVMIYDLKWPMSQFALLLLCSHDLAWPTMLCTAQKEIF